jgi:hypothetical protein
MSQGMLTPDKVESLVAVHYKKSNYGSVILHTRYGPIKVNAQDADFYGVI